MHIKIIAVGKLKESYLKTGIDEYLKRLTPFAKVEIIEVADEKAPDTLSPKEEDQIKDAEGQRILRAIKPGSHTIVLDVKGRERSSEIFAKELADLALRGKSEINFVIGGSLGHSQAVLDLADDRLSFSPMTLPHQLMRLVLVEQVYRAFKINRGETYHK